MFAENIGCALRLNDAHAHSRAGEAGASAVNFGVDTCFHALSDRGLHSISGRFSFLQLDQALLPLRELGIAQGGILDDLVTLVFRL